MSLAGFPAYQSNPPALFKYLSGLLTAAVADGDFSRYLHRLSVRMNAVGTMNASCIVTAYEHLNVIYPSTFTPTAAPVTVVGLGKLGSAELAGVVIAALMFGFLIILIMYTVIRRVGRKNRENNLMKKYSFANSMQEAYPIEKEVQFTLKDSDLDKLEYVGDTAKI